LFKVPSMKWAFIGTAFFACVATALMYWAPAFMMRAMHIKEDTAGLIVGGLAIMGILGTFVGGVITDMWYKKNPKARMLVGVIGAPIATIGAVIGIWLVFSGQYVIGLILLGVYAFGVQMYLPGVITAIQEVVHPGAKGLAQSMEVLIPLILAAPAPALVGALSDALGGGASGLAYGLMLVGLVALGAIPCLLRGAKYFEQDMDKVKHLTLEADK
ncbi:MAG: MFS transporter, partial [Chloroflexi bacterium]|nr:MFS transporter [Chloroflexota bacterium]